MHRVAESRLTKNCFDAPSKMSAALLGGAAASLALKLPMDATMFCMTCMTSVPAASPDMSWPTQLPVGVR